MVSESESYFTGQSARCSPGFGTPTALEPLLSALPLATTSCIRAVLAQPRETDAFGFFTCGCDKLTDRCILFIISGQNVCACLCSCNIGIGKKRNGSGVQGNV